MNIAQMMKQAQVMQDRMKEMQERLGETDLEASAGGDLVKVVMTCSGLMRRVVISPTLIPDADTRETLEDLIAAAVNSGKKAGDGRLEDETRKLMAGMGLPAGMKLPF